MFAGDRLLLYAFVRSQNVEPATVRLSATSPSGPVVVRRRPRSVRVPSGTTVATLAARARIRELEESPEWTSTRGSRQQRSKDAGVSREIIDLAIKYGLMSRETSFVAVERRATPVVGEMQLRRIPIALTSGWGGLERKLLGRPARACPSPSMLDTQAIASRRRIGAGTPGVREKDVVRRGGRNGFPE